MAITIDATVGGLASNSYSTLADAIAYFDGRLHSDFWDGASTEDRNKALVSATTRLDHENFIGGRVTALQALRWPRTGIVDRDGVNVGNDEIVKDIIWATYELALAMLGIDIQALNTTTDFKKLVVDTIELEPNIHGSRKGNLPDEVQRLIQPFIFSNTELLRA